jgi:transcription initiation factor TFIIB
MARRDHTASAWTHRTYERTFDEDERSTDETTSTATCPECDGRVVTNAAETVCADCGLILASTPVDRGPEWRCADETDEPVKRTGAPRTIARHDDGLTTQIGSNSDVQGERLSERKRRQLGRLRREHGRAKFRSKVERNRAHGLGEIRRVVGNLELPRTIRDRACQLFRRAQNENLLRGRSIEMVAMGGVYAACRERGTFRSLDELAATARCSRQQVRHGYQVLVIEFELQTPPFPLDARVARLVSQLDIGTRAAGRAHDLATVAEETGVTNGTQPAGVAAACVYMATQEYGPSALTQAACAEAASTTPNTLRERWQELERVTSEGNESEPTAAD